MSSAACPVEIIPGHRENDSGIARKPFAFPPESLFDFSPESCSSSPRNAFHDHPGIAFTFLRNPQSPSILKCDNGRSSLSLAGDFNSLWITGIASFFRNPLYYATNRDDAPVESKAHVLLPGSGSAL